MSIFAPIAPAGRSIRFYSFLLALALFSFGNDLSAGLLDKLKESLGASDQKEQSLDSAEVGAGLKEALRVGTETVVGNLGQPGGFNLDPEIHIPLPGQLEQVKRWLGKVGMDSLLVDLETELNEAAEVATPKAKDLFFQAINEMTLDDVMAIYQGPDDAATQYFRSKMSAPLAAEMKPVVDVDLSDYVVEKGMDGIFYYLAKEEAAIRKDPVKRTTDLLQKVFGN